MYIYTYSFFLLICRNNIGDLFARYIEMVYNIIEIWNLEYIFII